MQSSYNRLDVSSNEEISEGIYKLSIKGKFTGNPGQFYMVRSWNLEPFLSRPISIHHINEEGISFLFERRGRGTEILSQLKPGEPIELLGPLGNGFDLERIKGKIAVVTGGIGIAPMLHTVKLLEKRSIDLYAGFRDKPYTIEAFKQNVSNIYVSSDKGINGHKGYITELFNPKVYDMVLCCGPTALMDRVMKECKNSNIPIYVSMESHMACGVGACLGCTCRTKEGNKRTCKDGPVFSGEDVVINDEN